MESMVKDSNHPAKCLPSFAELVSDLKLNKNHLIDVLNASNSMEEEDLSTGNIIAERDKNCRFVKNIDLVSHNDDTVLGKHLSDQTATVMRYQMSAELQGYNDGNIDQSKTITGDDDNRDVSKKTLINDYFPAWIKAPLMLNQVSSDSRCISDITCCYDDHIVPAKDRVQCWFKSRQAMEDISSNSVFNSVYVQGHNKMILNSPKVPKGLGNSTVIEHVDAVVGFDKNDKTPTRKEVEDIILQSQIYPTIDQGTGQQYADDSCDAKNKEIYSSNEQTIVWSESGSILNKMAGPTHCNNQYNSLGSAYKQLPSQQFMNSKTTAIFEGKEIIWPSFGDNEVNREVDTMNYSQSYSLAACPVQHDQGKGLANTYMASQTYLDKTFCEKKQDEMIHLSLESIQACPSDNISEDSKPRLLTAQSEHRIEMGNIAWSSLGTQAYPNAGASWHQTPLQREVYPQDNSTNPTSARFLYHPLTYRDCRNQEGRRDLSFLQFDKRNQESKMPYLPHVQQKLKMETIDTYDEISSAKDRLSFHEQIGLCEDDYTLTTMEHNNMHRQALLTKSNVDFQRQQTVSMLQQDVLVSDIGSVATETSPFVGQVDPLTCAYAFSTPFCMDQTFTSAESKTNQDQKSSVSSSSEYILYGAQRKELWLGDSGYFGLQASVPRLNNFGQDNQLYRHERVAPVDRWQHSDNPISPKRIYEEGTRTFSWMDPQVNVENFMPVNPNLIHNNCISTVSRRHNQMQTQMSLPNCEDCPYGIDSFPLVNRKSDCSVQSGCSSSPSIHTEKSSLSTSSDFTMMKSVPSTRRKQKTYNANRLRRPKNGFIRFANEKRKELAKKYPRLNNRQISRLLGNRWKQMSEEDKKPYELSFYEELKKLRDEQPEWKWRNASEPKDTNQIMTTRLRPRNRLKVQHSLNAIIGHSARSSETEQDKSVEPSFGNKDCWVQCDLCLKWRQLPEGVVMETEIPTFWFCYMNPDTSKSACYVEEELPAPTNH
ncbi:hypothetical protein CHS0354_042819 [Potamilus streckersoni]|uniref:Uncharacterized protein n=1 Tax=Potamilus streckersoni TaxID=2493646 RepID=A0AAE0T5Z3_9BIVA|nr:hypothetical protein CHS0354_042819 [Potamilus streckersoni]